MLAQLAFASHGIAVEAVARWLKALLTRCMLAFSPQPLRFPSVVAYRQLSLCVCAGLSACSLFARPVGLPQRLIAACLPVTNLTWHLLLRRF